MAETNLSTSNITNPAASPRPTNKQLRLMRKNQESTSSSTTVHTTPNPNPTPNPPPASNNTEMPSDPNNTITPAATPTRKFRSHNDVLHRIIHDPAYDSSQYMIGYLDRFDGIREIGIEEWMERRRVCHEEFVPGHRVLFFKEVGGGGSGSGSQTQTQTQSGKGGDGGGARDINENENDGGNENPSEKASKPSLPHPSPPPPPPPPTPIQKSPKPSPKSSPLSPPSPEEWDGTLTEDIKWEEWNKRGTTSAAVDSSSDGKIPGRIVWDRRKRVDLIFGSGQ